MVVAGSDAGKPNSSVAVIATFVELFLNKLAPLLLLVWCAVESLFLFLSAEERDGDDEVLVSSLFVSVRARVN